MAESIQNVSLAQETRERYRTYALSVITSRALPDVRDGLKPVQRRILYTMFHELRLYFDGRPAKCARIVGDVMGKFHPHGDLALYEALVRLTQDWVMRHPLILGQGNFGSVDGDAPAHHRYTEAKLTAVADRLLHELRQNTVDMRPTYNNETTEPVVLPAQYPNLLVNGTSGIAVGMATNIPPHNLGDVIKACIQLIEDPESTTAVLLDKIKGPDFPLGGKVVTERATLREIYETGTGTIKVQGEWKEEKVGRRSQIVITSIPYGVNKGALEGVIGGFIEDRKLPQLLGLTNESNEKEGLRIVLETKPDTDPNLVMAYLYRHTELQKNFSYNMTCLIPVLAGGKDESKTGLKPATLGLKAILQHFLDFRLETVRRRFEFELEQLRRRIHILEGFCIVFDALDKALKLIRASQGKDDARQKLMQEFKLSEEQANAIVEAQLYRIAQMEIQKILQELEEKKAEAERIEGILRSKKKLWGVVTTELNEVAEQFSERRRTRMGSAEDTPDFDPEAYIVRENAQVVITREGWIKRVGRLSSVESTRVREGDAVLAVVPGSTLDHVVLFSDDGMAYTMRINEVPASSGYGEPIAKFFRLADQVKIIGAVTTDERFTPTNVKPARGDPPGPYLFVVTIQGQTLRTPLEPFRTASTKAGRKFVRLGESDKVVLATVPKEEKTIYLVSANGHVLHFEIKDVNVLSGAGKGVIGIKLEEGDICLGGTLMGGRFDKCIIETSGGKLFEFGPAKYDVTSRGGKGFEAVKRASFVRMIPPPIELVDWEQIEGKKTNGHKANDDQRSLFEN